MHDSRGLPRTYISSRGEMKMSLKLIICKVKSAPCDWTRAVHRAGTEDKGGNTHILMSEMLEQLQLAIGTL